MMRYPIFIFTLLVIGLSWMPTRAQPDSSRPDAQVIAMETRLRLRDAPSFDSHTIGWLEPNTPLNLIGRTFDSNWLNIQRADAVEGWVNAAYITVNIDLAQVAVTTNLDLLGHPLQLSDKVADNLRQIYAYGQALGNHADVFSKVGDSITAAPNMLKPIGEGLYNLGDYQYLQSIIDTFSKTPARDANSFANTSLAAGVGWTTDAVLKAKFADPQLCLPDESALACEYRLVKPAYALIMFGTNDVAHLTAKTYAYNMGRIIKSSIEAGIIPIVSTIPLRVGYEEQVTTFNEALLKVVQRYRVPLWDFGAAMHALPKDGLAPDGVHPSIPAAGYKGSADFRANNLYYGYVIRNLTALQMLDEVLLAVQPAAIKKPR